MGDNIIIVIQTISKKPRLVSSVFPSLNEKANQNIINQFGVLDYSTNTSFRYPVSLKNKLIINNYVNIKKMKIKWTI